MSWLNPKLQSSNYTGSLSSGPELRIPSKVASKLFNGAPIYIYTEVHIFFRH